jgi:hypothetical protein
MSFVLLAAVLAAVPVGGLVFLKWRFAPSRVRARTDRLLADAEAKLEGVGDEELVRRIRDDAFLNGVAKGSKAAGRIRSLVDKQEFAKLATEWGDLWPGLLAADPHREGQRSATLDHIIGIGAAVAVLARRHPA